MDDLTILIPVISKELPRLTILLQSLKYFVVLNNIKVIFLTPLKDDKKVKEIVNSLINTSYTVLNDEDITDIKENGWYKQQLLKLLMVKYITTPFYLVLDCDNICTAKFSVQDLIKNNKGILELQETPDNFQNLSEIYKILDCEPIKHPFPVMKVTPALLSTEIVKNMLLHIQKKNNILDKYLFKQFSTVLKNNQYVTEYMLYFVYAKITGLLEQYHFYDKITGNNNVWFIDQVFDWDPKKAFNDQGFFCVYQGNCNVPDDIVLDQVREYIGLGRDTNVPKISCLLVTKDRLEHVKIAIDCFQKQTYPNKELIVVCDSNDGVKEYIFSLNDNNIKIYQLQPKSMTLGELRNYSINVSEGEYVIQWDDDDWYHPSRLSIQYQFLSEKRCDAILLSQWIMAWPSEDLYSISDMRKDGWEGTMLCKKSVLPRYKKLRKFEDTILMRELAEKANVCIITDPGYYVLYIYLVHGKNTWDRDHFSDMFKYSIPIADVWKLPKERIQILREKMANLVGREYIHKSREKNNIYICLAVISLILILFICGIIILTKTS